MESGMNRPVVNGVNSDGGHTFLKLYPHSKVAGKQ